MIIKKKRVKAKGGALKRALKHVTDGEDNDVVELVQGSVADLDDARRDAIRLGREYCVRHWILSPQSDLTIEQLIYLLALLATEFGFEPSSAVVFKHRKPRASDDFSSEHYHVLVREVNAVDGSVLTSAHDFRKHEKISRIVEVEWGKRHRLTTGAHNRSVAHFLAGGEKDHVVSAMVAAGLLDAERPMESFNEADQQEAKRKGLDLPRLRILISDTLGASVSRDQFDKKLLSIGLRIRAGEKPDTPVVETLDGKTVGSLARLTRIRKAALQQRMKFNGSSPAAYDAETTEWHGQEAGGPPFGNSSVDTLLDHQAEAGGNVGEPSNIGRSAGSDGHYDQATPKLDTRHRANSQQAGGPSVCAEPDPAAERREPSRSDLIVALGCAEKHNALLDLLGVARRSAMSPLDRVLDDLETLIEEKTALIGRPVKLSEPASLIAAREAAKTSKQIHAELAAEENGAVQALAALPKATLWRRFWYRVEAKQRSRLTASLDRKRASVAAAERIASKARSRLVDETSQYQKALTTRKNEAEKEAKAAELALPVLRAAKTLVSNNPHLAIQGANRLVGMASKLHNDLTLVDDHEDRPSFQI